MYLLGEASTALKVLVDILGVAGILIFGIFVLVFLVDLILSGVDGHKGIFFNRKSPDVSYNPVEDEPVKDGVMYYQNENPNKEPEPEQTDENSENVTGVDFDKAIEEQKQLMAQNPVPVWEDDEDEEDITGIIEDVTKQALAELDAEKAPKVRKVYKVKTPEVEEVVAEPEVVEEPVLEEQVVEEEPAVDEEKLALERKVAELEEQRKQDREELLKTLQELKEKEPVIVEKEENDKKYANIARMNARLNSIKKTSAKLKEKKEEQKVAPKEEVVTTVVEETVVHEPIETPVPETVVVEQKVEEVKTEKPRFKKEYYENRLATLESDLKEAQKELKANNKEYMPIVKVKKAYEKDSEKLRRKEAQVAKQKVAIYGVNKSGKINEAKRQKLEENVQLLKELKDSVYNCEQVIEKNKDRFPILEKNHKLIAKQVKRLEDDITSVKEALKWYAENEQE